MSDEIMIFTGTTFDFSWFFRLSLVYYKHYGGIIMGMVKAEITLKNVGDVHIANNGLAKDQDIRQATITALVDTGAATLVINENLRQQLGLGILGTREARMANNVKETVQIADPVEVHWKNRSMVCRPWVISGNGRILLGAIPLEDMDLMVDPTRQELVGAHGDEQIGDLY
jgi:clan AA aspartic protease